MSYGTKKWVNLLVGFICIILIIFDIVDKNSVLVIIVHGLGALIFFGISFYYYRKDKRK